MFGQHGERLLRGEWRFWCEADEINFLRDVGGAHENVRKIIRSIVRNSRDDHSAIKRCRNIVGMFFNRERMSKNFLRLQLNAAKLPAKNGSRDDRRGARSQAGANR